MRDQAGQSATRSDVVDDELSDIKPGVPLTEDTGRFVEDIVGTIELNHIRKRLQDDFAPHVDISDWAGRKPEEVERMLLSRSLAAFAVSELLETSPIEACADITDGFGDNGIDAIGIDSQTGIVVVVQSKWVEKGQDAPSLGDVEKFAHGFRDLIAPRFDRFNSSIQSKQGELIAALDNPDVKFVLALAYSGSQPLGNNSAQVLDDLLLETNDVSDVVTLEILDQRRLHDLIRKGVAGKAPDLAVTLHHWGVVEDPFKAFYGQVDAADIADWWATHRDSLFDRNLRKFIHDSSVNSAIEATALQSPEYFWYFNNGVTVLCEEIAKAPVGGGSRKSGNFVFKGATVVNGAQTVGSLGRAAAQSPASVEDARVLARFISLQDVPADFATEVTRATNTQNRVERRDFVALDVTQERLKLDLKLEQGKHYAIKTGEPDPERDKGCTVVEATVALACADSAELAVQAKREIGRLWEDVTKPPYKTLFRSNLSATEMWNAVQVLRTVDDVLKNKQKTLTGRDRSVVVHGNRLIAHLVFSRLPAGTLSQSASIDKLVVTSSADAVLEEIIDVMAESYGTNYVASLFKNASKCRDVVKSVSDRLGAVGAQ